MDAWSKFFLPMALRISNWTKPGAKQGYADPNQLAKAASFLDRFREIVSDPVNLLIERVKEAGFVDAEGLVVLHNGNRVPIRGRESYYEEFSDILVINRGVHEPLEEYCFQQVLLALGNPAPVMVELGAYWAHYSMWLKRRFPAATCYMVEGESDNLAVGRSNFRRNGFDGTFLENMVGRGGFEVDAFMRDEGLKTLTILHADIQGAEIDMLDGASATLAAGLVEYVFISTHSESLHVHVLDRLQSHRYTILVSSGYAEHSTSCDGFILAAAPQAASVIDPDWQPLGRLDILRSTPERLVEYLHGTFQAMLPDGTNAHDGRSSSHLKQGS
jgi:hypothetical protein